jgi:hypothetical protein
MLLRTPISHAPPPPPPLLPPLLLPPLLTDDEGCGRHHHAFAEHRSKMHLRRDFLDKRTEMWLFDGCVV